MNNKEKKDIQFDIEAGEDVTVYGEFVASYFAWLPPERQKQRAKELDEKTKKKNKSGQ